MLTEIQRITICILYFAVGIVFTIIIHEFAHLAVAIACRWKIHEIRIGPFTFEKARWCFGRPLLAGHVEMAPRSRSSFRRDIVLITLAGPAANVLSGAYMLVRENRWILVMGAVQVVIGLRTLIPYHKNSTRNDGYLGFVLSRNTEWLAEQYTLMTRGGTSKNQD